VKVRVVLTIDVDDQAWRDEYAAHDLTNAEIREAVKRSVEQVAEQDGIIAPAGIIRSATLVD
jgi:hypothetical protein